MGVGRELEQLIEKTNLRVGLFMFHPFPLYFLKESGEGGVKEGEI